MGAIFGSKDWAWDGMADMDRDCVADYVKHLCEMRNIASEYESYTAWCIAVTSELVMLLTGESDGAAGNILAAVLKHRGEIMSKETHDYH